jgi:hypothetical protein
MLRLVQIDGNNYKTLKEIFSCFGVMYRLPLSHIFLSHYITHFLLNITRACTGTTMGHVCCWYGRVIAEAVSRWLPTAVARVRQVGFVVDKVASGQVFSEYFGFRCQNRSFHQLLHHHNHPGKVAEALRRADHPSKESCLLP